MPIFCDNNKETKTDETFPKEHTLKELNEKLNDIQKKQDRLG